MKLTATRKTFHFENESGYSFDVEAEERPGRGWTATVTIRAGGYVTAEDAVRRVAETARAFIGQVEES